MRQFYTMRKFSIAVPNGTGLYRGLLKAEAWRAGERDFQMEVSHF
jgi:hypothetical protein